LLPPEGDVSSDTLLGRFLEYVESRKLQLYPAQETAILELFEGRNVILNTPTGSGKSLVASALHFQSLAEGRRSIYTCPIKALVNEKWMALCREFGPDNVGLSTGDATVNRDAPILCCTAEILANMALRAGADADVDDVVMDEFHYYSDRERGVAWQVPLLTLTNTRFLLMSATLGEIAFFEEALTKLNGFKTSTVSSTERPVPLEHRYSDLPLATTLETLVAEKKIPVYVVHFTQLEAAQSAQDFTSINVCSKEEKAAIAQAIEGFKFSSPYGPEIKRWLRHGIGVHHAGLLPKYRVLVEQLAQRGLLKVICGTDTLGVGINVPIRTVLFTRLCKFDGQKTGILTARDFHQIGGRAGRKGFDDVGWVVAQAPEHVVENLKLEEKAKRDGKKIVKRQPPEKNFVNWDKQTFARLIAAPPEKLQSRFAVSHGMLLNVLSRDGDGCRAMQRLIADSHESPKQKQAHRTRAWQLFRALVEKKIIEFTALGRRRREEAQTALPEKDQSLVTSSATDRKLRINVELPENFSMDQTLSLYLLETIPLLNPESPDYALDLLTLVESILEDPDFVLRKQLDRVKDQKMAEMKAEGVEYQDRMDELEKCEHPKPCREFVYSTFNEFAAKHPWVGQENIRPKSIVREMFEQFRSFGDYIKDYELQRAEGVLLRHINNTFKVLTKTVPDTAKNDALREMEEYLSVMIRQTDSSLLEEWERMRDPNYVSRAEEKEVRPPGAEEAARDVTRDTKVFTAAIRTRVFNFLRAVVNDDLEAALANLSSPDKPDGTPWTVSELSQQFADYYADHEYIRLDPEARNARHTYVVPSEDKQSWKVEQVLVDPEVHNDWVAEFSVNLAASRAAAEPVIRLIGVRSVGRA
jgi:superfamily II RNA helicase